MGTNVGPGRHRFLAGDAEFFCCEWVWHGGVRGFRILHRQAWILSEARTCVPVRLRTAHFCVDGAFLGAFAPRADESSAPTFCVARSLSIFATGLLCFRGRIGRFGDRPAYDDVGCAGGDGFGWSDDTNLISDLGSGGANSGSHDGEVSPSWLRTAAASRAEVTIPWHPFSSAMVARRTTLFSTESPHPNLVPDRSRPCWLTR